MGKLIRNNIEYGGGNGTDIYEVTQSQYNTLKQAGTLVRNALYVISDGDNLNPTADDIEYSSGVTVKQAIDSKADTSTTYTKSEVDTSFGKTIYQGSLSAGNKTIDDIQSWCKTAEKGTYWFNAYMTSPFSGWTIGMVTNKQITDTYAEIVLFYNDHIVTSFTGTLTSTTPTWTTKSGSLS